MRPHGFIFGIFPLFFILAACGGGGSSPEAQTSLPQTSRQQQPKLVDTQKPTEKNQHKEQTTGTEKTDCPTCASIVKNLSLGAPSTNDNALAALAKLRREGMLRSIDSDNIIHTDIDLFTLGNRFSASV